jgi:hypothetical protein
LIRLSTASQVWSGALVQVQVLMSEEVTVLGELRWTLGHTHTHTSASFGPCTVTWVPDVAE